MKGTSGSRSGTVLESLTLKVGGETLGPPQGAVLSCGGIFFPRRTIPTELRTWHQIVNLPSNEQSAKIFGFNPPEPGQDLEEILLKDSLN